jgi:hypothetical protein
MPPSNLKDESHRRMSEIAFFSKIEAYEKNYRRHIVNIPRIIF